MATSSEPNFDSPRDKAVLVGLYLSKFDQAGLEALGFSTFSEAFNGLGYSIGVNPSSIKNYRDEFDPLFPNARKGWHHRKTRKYCMAIHDAYQKVELDRFVEIMRGLVNVPIDDEGEDVIAAEKAAESKQFASRLITGLAAENYFLFVFPEIAAFSGCSIENTTMLGCGYDFRLRNNNSSSFLAVEVKGLQGQSGTVSLTSKEHKLALQMGNSYYLFVAKNFVERPSFELFMNPLQSQLSFVQRKSVVISYTWHTTV